MKWLVRSAAAAVFGLLIGFLWQREPALVERRIAAAPAAGKITVTATAPRQKNTPQENIVADNKLASPDQPKFTIFVKSEGDTDFHVAVDLARFVAPQAGVALDVLAGQSALESVRRLSEMPGASLAIVQYDVIQALRARAAAGDAAATHALRPLRAVMPLYMEEIHFLVRADSPLTHIHQIRGRRINAGPSSSDGALTAAALYKLLFNAPMPKPRTSFLESRRALKKLQDGTLDVAVLVTGQPADLLMDLSPEERRSLKLLELDRTHPTSRQALRFYLPVTIRAANYGAWLTRDVPTLAVMSYLLTADTSDEAAERLGKFARALCENFPVLANEGHHKWREVQLGLDLGTGWPKSPVAEQALHECLAEARGQESRALSKDSRPGGRPAVTGH